MQWMLGAGMHSGAEAHRLGLVQELVTEEALRGRALEIAAGIAAQAPLAVQATMANARRAERDGDAAAAAELPMLLDQLAHTEDAQRAMSAFLSGTPAVFRGA